ncbi:MAG TPA: hypothetical protein VKI65_14135, partial [Gemmataceae bacterium]|nr:hypothetical protein [Gemmataceae bacterium]
GGDSQPDAIRPNLFPSGVQAKYRSKSGERERDHVFQLLQSHFSSKKPERIRTAIRMGYHPHATPTRIANR